MINTHSLHIGDTVFYVLVDGSPLFRIHKTRIAEVTKKSYRMLLDKYSFRCEDGYRFESVESLRPSFIFFTRKEAISFIIKRLRSEIEYEKNYIITARQRLAQLQASLKVYTAAARNRQPTASRSFSTPPLPDRISFVPVPRPVSNRPGASSNSMNVILNPTSYENKI